MTALLKGTPSVLIGFGIQRDMSIQGMGDVVQENKMGWLVEFLGANAVLGQSKPNVLKF